MLVPEAELVHHARPEVLDDHVGLGGEAQRDRGALGLVEVEHDRPLAPVAHEEERVMSFTDTPIQRAMSPMPGRSTFTTSAPWSASRAVA